MKKTELCANLAFWTTLIGLGYALVARADWPVLAAGVVAVVAGTVAALLVSLVVGRLAD